MDIGASNWNETDASNSSAAPDGAPEGMQPSGVNDTIRAIMGAIKRWFNWSSPKTTAGTSTAYTLSYGVAPGALVDGMSHLVEFDQANGNGATLNVNSLGAQPIYYYSAGAWRAIPANLLGANEVVRVVYHSTSGAYRLIGRPDRTGVVEDFAGTTAPAGSLLCYGQAISRTAYAGLFAALGTVHGAGDGSTTFNLPDLRGRTTAGKDDMGGSSAARLSTYIASTTLGAAGGSQNQSGIGVSVSVGVSGTLNGTAFGDTANETASAASGSGAKQLVHTHSVSVSGSLSGSGGGSTGTIPTVQPTGIMNKIVRI